MRLPGALFLIAIFLQVSFCNGAMVQTISQLAASKAEIREQAEKNLFAADSGELLEGLTNFVQSPESNPRAAEAGILFLRKKDVELPNRLLPIANKIPSPQVRAALLNSVVLSRSDTNALKSVEQIWPRPFRRPNGLRYEHPTRVVCGEVGKPFTSRFISCRVVFNS